MEIEYALQEKPNGIAEAFLIGEKFIGDEDVTLILGDNIFYGNLDFVRKAVQKNQGATVFGYYVTDPERYGVVEFDDSGRAVSLEEKPAQPKSNYAVVGLYIYNKEVVTYTRNLKPSGRGELEITDLNKIYLNEGKLDVELMGRGIAWLDTGTPQALLDASTFIGAIEKRQGLKVACIEEAAYMMNYISAEELGNLIDELPKSDYRTYLEKVRNDEVLHARYQK
jgi:glucose-1-phosphate thymidylyltransferase